MTARTPAIGTPSDSDAPVAVLESSACGMSPTPTPSLSWYTETTAPGWLQAHAEIQVERRSTLHTHRFDGSESLDLPWPFAPLEPREQVSLRVRVTGTDKRTGPWSDWTPLTAAMLAPGEWSAHAIGLPAPTTPALPGRVRTEFVVAKGLHRATLYATSLGAYQISINGVDVDDHVLKPGWTSYNSRILHETTDVGALLREGKNAIGIRFAGAWATERYGLDGNPRRLWAQQPAVAAQIVLDYSDGGREWLITNEEWRAAAGPITASSLYHGEQYDARLDQPGWDTVGFDDVGWEAAAVCAVIPEPEPRTSPPVRRQEQVPVRAVHDSPSGEKILDFGQNLVGRLRLTARGKTGDTITIRHAEVLENGELSLRPLRDARATDQLILDGDEVTWEPEFTYHGFRYAGLTGWPGQFDPAAITATVLHSDLDRTGTFHCSHSLLERFHENVVWSLRGNFLSIPTDCPQRDERLGWTGDIQIFAPAASFLYDVRAFLSSWLTDLALEQKRAGGIVPLVVPNVLGDPVPAAAWGDAAVIVPWVLLERFGDGDTVRRQYESIKSWSELLIERTHERGLWAGDFQFGDWLDPHAPPENPGGARTDVDLVATAYAFHCLRLAGSLAERLGHSEDRERFQAAAERTRTAFNREYITPAGRVVSDTPTAYALAIVFGIAPDTTIPALGERLATLVRSDRYHIGTGFVGTPLILDALTITGQHEATGRMLMQTDCPSWLYPVTMGATTVWERWDSIRPDGSINPGRMTSFNHYALGAIADWLHRRLAGLAPASEGYRTLRIAPVPVNGIDHAAATLRTRYGLAATSWIRDGESIDIRITIPPNTTALVELPGHAPEQLGSGIHERRFATLPRAAAAPVTLESSISAIVDDAEAFAEVDAFIRRRVPRLSASGWLGLPWEQHLRLDDVVESKLDPGEKRALALALERFNARREGDPGDFCGEGIQ